MNNRYSRSSRTTSEGRDCLRRAGLNDAPQNFLTAVQSVIDTIRATAAAERA